MAIKWLSESDAEKYFKETLVDWHLAYNYKGCYSPGETTKYVLSFFSHKEKQSPTAKKIYEYVMMHPKTIYVVGMRGGFQCFDSTAGEHKDMPVLFIDVDGKLEIFVRAPHGLSLGTTREPWEVKAEKHFGRAKARAGFILPDRARANSILMTDPTEAFSQSKLIADEVGSGKRAHYDYAIGKRVSLDNRIAALHEFGHAKQWLERPMFFDQQRKAAQSLSKEAQERRRRTAVKGSRIGQFDPKKRAAALKLGGSEQDVRLGDRRKGFAEDLQKAAEKRWTQAGVLDPNIRTAEDVKEFEDALTKAPVWGRAIEMDNMSRHEWPICRELGIPFRTNYRDLDAHTTAELTTTTQIIRLAEKKKQELALAEAAQREKEQKAREIEARSKQVPICPHCNLQFRNQVSLRVHVEQQHP